MRRAFVIFVCALFLACTVGGLDLTGKACPCTDGFVCDTARDVCVDSVPDATPAPPPTDSDATDADAGDADAPLLSITGLTATWSTSNTIRWDWVLNGEQTHFVSYEVIVGPTQAAVAARTGITTLTKDERPELGAFDVRGGAMIGPIAMWTLTESAVSSTPQFVQVNATDDLGRVAHSAIAMGTTAVNAGSAYVIFSGTKLTSAMPVGFSYIPGATSDAGYYLGTTACPIAPCDMQDELTTLGEMIPPTTFDFDTAFLEISIKGDAFSTAPAAQSLVGITVASKANCVDNPEMHAGRCRYAFRFFTTPAGASTPTRIQVPLRTLSNPDNILLTSAKLVEYSYALDTLTFEGTWIDGTSAYLYDARIRW